MITEHDRIEPDEDLQRFLRFRVLQTDYSANRCSEETSARRKPETRIGAYMLDVVQRLPESQERFM